MGEICKGGQVRDTCVLASVGGYTWAFSLCSSSSLLGILLEILKWCFSSFVFSVFLKSSIFLVSFLHPCSFIQDLLYPPDFCLHIWWNLRGEDKTVALFVRQWSLWICPCDCSCSKQFLTLALQKEATFQSFLLPFLHLSSHKPLFLACKTCFCPYSRRYLQVRRKQSLCSPYLYSWEILSAASFGEGSDFWGSHFSSL